MFKVLGYVSQKHRKLKYIIDALKPSWRCFWETRPWVDNRKPWLLIFLRHWSIPLSSWKGTGYGVVIVRLAWPPVGGGDCCGVFMYFTNKVFRNSTRSRSVTLIWSTSWFFSEFSGIDTLYSSWSNLGGLSFISSMVIDTVALAVLLASSCWAACF